MRSAVEEELDGWHVYAAANTRVPTSFAVRPRPRWQLGRRRRLLSWSTAVALYLGLLGLGSFLGFVVVQALS